MVKLRDGQYCNLKLLLLFLVVWGHWLEGGTSSSIVLREIYRLIYYIHMPLFSFLSGLFVFQHSQCIAQLKRLFPLYLALQLPAALLSGGDVLTPVWHLWYLLSCCTWLLTTHVMLYFKQSGTFILAGALLLGLLAGFVPWVGRSLSLSRTIVFFPYFWAGVLCRADTPWHKWRGQGILALLLGVGLILLLGRDFPLSFLYQARPYTSPQDALLRLGCYGVGFAMGFGLLTLTPRRRFPFTRMGADTLWLYLLHAPVVYLLRQGWRWWLLSPIASALLIFILYQLTRWHTSLYGIIPKGRRDRPWPNLKTSTNTTARRSTGSSSP